MRQQSIILILVAVGGGGEEHSLMCHGEQNSNMTVAMNTLGKIPYYIFLSSNNSILLLEANDLRNCPEYIKKDCSLPEG